MAGWLESFVGWIDQASTEERQVKIRPSHGSKGAYVRESTTTHRFGKRPRTVKRSWRA